MKTFKQNDFQNFEQRYRAKFINSLSGVKSANMIGTYFENKTSSLCIVSSVFHLGANPALIGFINRPNTVPRHTLDNLKRDKFYTINHVNSEIFKKAHQTSARYEFEESEFEKVGLTEEVIEDFKAPFVKESNVKIGCELDEIIDLSNGTHFVIGKIVQVSLLEDAIAEDGHVDIESLDSVGVTGLDSYHTIKKLARLSYAKPDKDLEEL